MWNLLPWHWSSFIYIYRRAILYPTKTTKKSRLHFFRLFDELFWKEGSDKNFNPFLISIWSYGMTLPFSVIETIKKWSNDEAIKWSCFAFFSIFIVVFFWLISSQTSRSIDTNKYDRVNRVSGVCVASVYNYRVFFSLKWSYRSII